MGLVYNGGRVGGWGMEVVAGRDDVERSPGGEGGGGFEQIELLELY